MKEFKRSGVTEPIVINRTEKEKDAYQKAMVQFEKEMKAIRADAIYKSTRSQISAFNKTILYR